jgi:hypothetical protein
MLFVLDWPEHGGRIAACCLEHSCNIEVTCSRCKIVSVLIGRLKPSIGVRFGTEQCPYDRASAFHSREMQCAQPPTGGCVRVSTYSLRLHRHCGGWCRDWNLWYHTNVAGNQCSLLLSGILGLLLLSRRL